MTVLCGREFQVLRRYFKKLDKKFISSLWEFNVGCTLSSRVKCTILLNSIWNRQLQIKAQESSIQFPRSPTHEAGGVDRSSGSLMFVGVPNQKFEFDRIRYYPNTIQILSMTIWYYHRFWFHKSFFRYIMPYWSDTSSDTAKFIIYLNKTRYWGPWLPMNANVQTSHGQNSVCYLLTLGQPLSPILWTVPILRQNTRLIHFDQY